MTSGEFAVWFGVSVGVPVGLPILGMAAACWMLENRALHPFQILKDGQMLWFAIALAAGGMTEAIQTDLKAHAWVNVALAASLFGLLATSLFVLGCTALSQSKPLTEKKTWTLFRESPLLLGSFGITALVIIACSFVHARLP